MPSDYDVNDLNVFYNRFDRHDFSQTRTELIVRLVDIPMCEQGKIMSVTEDDVVRQLRKTNARKAAGPDGIKPKVLTLCAEHFCSVLTVIFNMSLSQSKTPSLWKTSHIVPVPKKTPVKVMNDLRPVALTSAVMKVLE